MTNIPNRERMEELVNVGSDLAIKCYSDPKLFLEIAKTKNSLEAFNELLIKEYGEKYSNITAAERHCIVTGFSETSKIFREFALMSI